MQFNSVCKYNLLVLCFYPFQVRNTFGSTRHTFHLLFVKISKMHNNGRYLGFIEPSDCPTGGHIIQLLRVLRLCESITEAVNSKVFFDVGKNFSPLLNLFETTLCGITFLLFARLGIH
jgi:hypothetical protein